MVAMVARTVDKAELRTNPEARAACQKEWDRLRAMKCWDESKVRESRHVVNDARATGVDAHIGLVFCLCVEKNSELPKGNPARKFKGRVCFQGNRVRSSLYEVALFQDLSACPAAIEAGKVVDMYAALPNCIGEPCDAEQAL